MLAPTPPGAQHLLACAQDRHAGELSAVVGDAAQRSAAAKKQDVQLADHSTAGQRRVSDQGPLEQRLLELLEQPFLGQQVLRLLIAEQNARQDVLA